PRVMPVSETPTKRTKLTPPQLALLWGIGVDKVVAWVHSGELRAIDGSTRRAAGRMTTTIIFRMTRRCTMPDSRDPVITAQEMLDDYGLTVEEVREKYPHAVERVGLDGLPCWD